MREYAAAATRFKKGPPNRSRHLLQSGHCRKGLPWTQWRADQKSKGPVLEVVLGKAATVHNLYRTATGTRAYRGPRGLVIRDNDSAAGCEGFAQIGPSGVDL